MRLKTSEIRSRCEEQGISLGELLGRAEVSRTAYYSLARKESVVPKSILRIAATLDVPVSEILDDAEAARAEMLRLAEEATATAARHKGTNPENIRHTLILLRHDPVERLRKALRRAS